jgi:hypothetical protein
MSLGFLLTLFFVDAPVNRIPYGIMLKFSLQALLAPLKFGKHGGLATNKSAILQSYTPLGYVRLNSLAVAAFVIGYRRIFDTASMLLN